MEEFKKIEELQSDELLLKRQLDDTKAVEVNNEVGNKVAHKWNMIAMYAEKGGVGKTTITASIGFMLASRGKRVLFYDCDPQRSLTNWCFGKEINVEYGENLDEFVNAQQLDEGCVRTFYDQVDPPDLDINEPLKPAHAMRVYPNLYLVMGNRDTCLLDERISMSEQNAKGKFSAFNVYAARTYLAVHTTAVKYQIDYVLLDLNPVRGTLNKRLISLSDYLIVPCYADFYGYHLMSNLPSDLRKWNEELIESKESANRTPYKIPNKEPVKFLGFIINNYHPYKGHFKIAENGIANDVLRRNQLHWFEKITKCADELPIHGENRDSNLLAKIRNYWQLEQIASIFFVPVPLLQERHAWKRFCKKPKKEDDVSEDEEEEKFNDEADFLKMTWYEIHARVRYVDAVNTRSGIKYKKLAGKHGFLDQVKYFNDIFSHLIDKIINVVEPCRSESSTVKIKNEVADY